MRKIVLYALVLCMSLSVWAGKTALPVAVYMQNLPAQRIGSLSDEEIVQDLKNQGFLVVMLDCSKMPKTSPKLETALTEWHKQTPTYLKQYDTDTTTFSLDHIYYIPEGYTYRKVAVWNFLDHGADGSLEYIMDKYNREIVPTYGKDSAFVYTDMVDKQGNQLDYNMYVDIIYPSGAASKKVPLLLNHASNSPRQKPFNPDQAEQIVYRTIFQLGFLTTGYAYANMDHCFNPVARNDVYKYFDNGYTLDDWDGLASNTACVRYLRSHLSEYNLDGMIGVMGISKASYAPVRLANRKNAEQREHYLFNSKENTKPQPWPGVPSTVEVAYAAAGNGTVRIPTYVDENTVPMITSAGKSDQYGQWDKYPAVVSHMENIDHNHISLWMEELGHTYPGIGIDLRTGESRYVLFKKFFDRYLKPFEVDTTSILYILPKEGAKEVNTHGESRVLTTDGVLPTSMMGISPYEPITVRYMYDVDTTNINAKIQILDSQNHPVPGVWTKRYQGTCLTFAPAQSLVKGETYRIKTGMIERSFTVTEQSEEDKEYTSRIFHAFDDTYTKVAKCTTAYDTDVVLKVRNSQYGDWKFYSYLKFVLVRDSINPILMKNAELRLASASSPASPVTVSVYETSNDWTGATLVSANRPANANNACAQIIFTGEQTWNTMDVTSVVKTALEAGQDTVSFCLTPGTGNSEYANFVSKEGAEALQPQLVINEYSPTTSVHAVRNEDRKAVCSMQNGRMVIERNGVRYSAMGAKL